MKATDAVVFRVSESSSFRVGLGAGLHDQPRGLFVYRSLEQGRECLGGPGRQDLSLFTYGNRGHA